MESPPLDTTLPDEIVTLLHEYQDLLELANGLPPNQDKDHVIILKDSTLPIFIRLF